MAQTGGSTRQIRLARVKVPFYYRYFSRPIYDSRLWTGSKSHSPHTIPPFEKKQTVRLSIFNTKFHRLRWRVWLVTYNMDADKFSRDTVSYEYCRRRDAFHILLINGMTYHLYLWFEYDGYRVHGVSNLFVTFQIAILVMAWILIAWTFLPLSFSLWIWPHSNDSSYTFWVEYCKFSSEG